MSSMVCYTVAVHVIIHAVTVQVVALAYHCAIARGALLQHYFAHPNLCRTAVHCH
jgi:hypothetical protein